MVGRYGLLGESLPSSRLDLVAAIAAGLMLTISLAGCGRKDGLDPPPSAQLPPAPGSSPQATSSSAPAPASPDSAAVASAQSPLAVPSLAPPPQGPPEKEGFDAQGNPVATPGQKKWFPLDFLLQ
jgi:predicted small lipoprotein YifL